MLLGEAMMRSFYRTVVVIELRGVIADDRGFMNMCHWCLYNADNTDIQDDGLVSVRRVERALDRAFSIRKAKAVVLRIASPGGTASESALLHARLKSLKSRAARRHQSRINRFHRRFLRFVTRMKPSSPPEVLAYVDELCTSGGYFAASAADRNPGRDHICFMLGFMSRPLGATPLRRAGPAAAGAVPGRWPLRGRESPQDRPPGRGAQCAFTASHECDHHRVTSLRTLVMRPVVILIGYTHISTTTAALGHLSQALCGTRPDRPTSA